MQVLDIGIFGVQKNLMSCLSSDPYYSSSVNQIIAIVDSWQRATIRRNVTSTFKFKNVVFISNKA